MMKGTPGLHPLALSITWHMCPKTSLVSRGSDLSFVLGEKRSPFASPPHTLEVGFQTIQAPLTMEPVRLQVHLPWGQPREAISRRDQNGAPYLSFGCHGYPTKPNKQALGVKGGQLRTRSRIKEAEGCSTVYFREMGNQRGQGGGRQPTRDGPPVAARLSTKDRPRDQSTEGLLTHSQRAEGGP